MRRMLILSLAAAAACGGPSRSDLIIDWTFEGKSCADAGVAEIHFAIANEVLSPDRFTCDQAAGGVDLGSFLVGDYQLTITGFDGAGVQTHQVVQTLQVRGRSGGRDEIAVDVPRVADSTTADLTWTFSPGPDCATANVQQVTIYIDPNPDGTGGPTQAPSLVAPWERRVPRSPRSRLERTRSPSSGCGRSATV